MSTATTAATSATTSSTAKQLLSCWRVEQPRTVSIVLGHLGATPQNLQRYSQLYTDRQCSVIGAASPPSRFMLNQSLEPTARAILQETVAVLKDTPPTVPLVIHSFSNGGAFLLEQIELLVSKRGDNTEEESTGSWQDFQLVASRLEKGCQIFDSCPCYIRPAWDWSHLRESFPNPHWSSMGRLCYTTAASWSLTLWCTATLSLHRPDRFWNHMRSSRACLHQVYVYSTCDMASDAAAVERLVAERRSAPIQADCTVHRYDDSNHCRLLKDHSLEYGQMIDAALEAAIDRCKSQAN